MVRLPWLGEETLDSRHPKAITYHFPYAISLFLGRVSCSPGYSQTHCVVKDALELPISLPEAPKFQGYRYVPPRLAFK